MGLDPKEGQVKSGHYEIDAQSHIKHNNVNCVSQSEKIVITGVIILVKGPIPYIFL